MKNLILITVEAEDNLIGGQKLMGDLNYQTSQVGQQCNMFHIHIF